MDRFFSKLDLRDIKIDPFKTSFPPDGEELPEEDVPVSVAPAPAEIERQPHVPAWASEPSVVFEMVIEQTADPVSAFVTESFPVEDVVTSGEVLKVSARSRPSAVAGAIAGVVREHGRAEVQAIGAGATNQAVKAVAIARGYLRETGIEAVCLPAFIDVTIDNEDRTAILLVVEPR